MLFILTLVRLLALSPVTFSLINWSSVNYAKAGNEMSWKLLLGSKGIISIKPSWSLVSIGILQGLKVGLILFNISVNNLDDETKCTFSKFADRTKLWGSSRCTTWVCKDLERLEKWAVRNSVEFHRRKCSLSPGEGNNCMHQCGLGADWLESSSVGESHVGPGGHQIERKPIICPWDKEDQQLPGLYGAECHWQFYGNGLFLSSREWNLSEVCFPVLGSAHKLYWS